MISETDALDNNTKQTSKNASAACEMAKKDAQNEFLNISGGGTVNISGGDFVGRDSQLFQGNIITGGDIIIHHSTLSSDVVNDRITAQITRLRGRVTRLIPTKIQLIKLIELRQPSSILTGLYRFLNAEVKFDKLKLDGPFK